MNDTTARLADAEAAETAMVRFIRPAFDVVKAEYTLMLANIGAKPLTHETIAGITNLSIALKVVGEVQSQLEALVSDGKVARAEANRASKVATLSMEQRRWANL